MTTTPDPAYAVLGTLTNQIMAKDIFQQRQGQWVTAYRCRQRLNSEVVKKYPC